MCSAIYDRDGSPVYCTFIKGHPPHCSWYALKIQDECDNESWRRETTVPKQLEPLVEAIASGWLDEHLEVILSAAHGRKRARHHR